MTRGPSSSSVRGAAGLLHFLSAFSFAAYNNNCWRRRKDEDAVAAEDELPVRPDHCTATVGRPRDRRYTWRSAIEPSETADVRRGYDGRPHLNGNGLRKAGGVRGACGRAVFWQGTPALRPSLILRSFLSPSKLRTAVFVMRTHSASLSLSPLSLPRPPPIQFVLRYGGSKPTDPAHPPSTTKARTRGCRWSCMEK